MRLLVKQGAKLTPSAQATLEASILAGPPRNMYRDDLDTNRWVALVDHSVWLRLSKLRNSGAERGSGASERITELSAANPDWHLDSHERDEFSHWMSGTGDPDYEDDREVDIAPRKRAEGEIRFRDNFRRHQRGFRRTRFGRIVLAHPCGPAIAQFRFRPMERARNPYVSHR